MASWRALWQVSRPLVAAIGATQTCRVLCDDEKPMRRIDTQAHLQLKKSELARKIYTESALQLVEWANKPESWWDGKSLQRKGGLEIMVYSKRVAGAPTIYCGQVDVDAAYEDLVRSSIGSPGARKEHYDPAVKEFVYLEDYGNGYALQRTVLHPQLGGIISGRFSDDFVGPYIEFCEDQEMFAHGGSGRNGCTAQRFLQGTELEFKFEPTTRTECQSQDCGLVMMRLGETRWRLLYFIQSNPGGNLPRWAVEMAMPSSIAGMLSLVQQDVLAQQNERK